MIFTETDLKGTFIIGLELKEDERGFLARSWCQTEFKTHGLNPKLVQCNISFSRGKGTLRGMHYQAVPCAEAKLVRCTQGEIYDVVIDIRPQSPTFRKWIAVELTAANHSMLYIPEGLAHGFQSLTKQAEVFYQMSEFYSPGAARGIRYDDPTFTIAWPLPVGEISNRDLSWPLFDLNSPVGGN